MMVVFALISAPEISLRQGRGPPHSATEHGWFALSKCNVVSTGT